jgi:hypothetical protein
MIRETIELKDSFLDITVKMSEGIPGAIVVLNKLTEVLGLSVGVMTILSLDDMNIRGSQIWVGFKDFCGEDIHRFIKAIQNRDPNMVAAINIGCVRGKETEAAVCSGASFTRERQRRERKK